MSSPRKTVSGWFMLATEQEKDEALRNADSAHTVDVVDDSAFDVRNEFLQIENHYVGFLAEIVLCRHFKWTRHFPPTKNIFDATDKEGRNVEVKMRRGFYSNHSENMMVLQVERNTDLAVLCYLLELEGSGETFVVIVKWFKRDFLTSHDWKIWVSKKIWTDNLKERGLPEKFVKASTSN